MKRPTILKYSFIKVARAFLWLHKRRFTFTYICDTQIKKEVTKISCGMQLTPWLC